MRKIAGPSGLPYTVTTLTSDETVWGNNGPVRLNVSVTASNGSSPTGRVYFLWDNGASTGSVDLVNGSAVYQSQPQGLGTRVVRAHYVSDYTNFQHGGSASPNLSLEIKRGATVTISTSPATIGPNDPVTVTVGVTGDYGAGLNGYVELLDGSIPLGTATLANGTATFQTSFSTNGVHVLTARYPGDSYYAPASRTYNQYVMAPTTVTLTATPSNPVYGQAVTLTATSSPATPTGGAFFYDNGMWIGSASATNGSAAFSTSSLSPGAHSLTVLFTPYEPGWLSGNGATTVTVAKASTSTALTLATPSVTIGAVAAFTALVTPSPASGTVQFLNGATVLGTANLVGGTASFSTSALGVGTHSIQAVYSGDTNYLTSTSAAASQTITKGTSTATLAVTPNPSTYLQPATLSAAVTPASATGTVQFLDGATVLGTVPVVSGAASIVVSNLAGGAHSLKAVYSGDSTYNGAASAAIAHTVNPASSLIAISLGSANPAVYGQVTAINVTVSFTTEPGTVRFFDGATQIASTTVLNGSGSAVVNGLGVGTHSLTAQFIGNSNFAPSTSTAITLVINKAASTLSLTRNPGSSVYGQTVTLTATASPVGATGVVTFRDGATVLGTATLNNGVATLAVSTLSVATHSLSATYAGDANFLAFTTAAQSHVVAKAPTTTTVVSSLNPSRRNQAVTFTATVVAPGATGQVRFFNGSSTLGTVNLLNGVAAYTASSFSQGTKSITARYLGDSNYLTSTSPVLSQVVNK